jgi:hypothetical protein
MVSGPFYVRRHRARLRRGFFVGCGYVRMQEWRNLARRWGTAMDIHAWILLALVSVGVLAGVRWRWARIPGAILVAAVTISFLEITPGNLARVIVADVGESPSAVCREDFFYPLIDATRREARILMLPILVLAIWAAVGDRWSGAKTG